MMKLDVSRPALATALGLLVLIAWDLSGLDMPMAHWFGGAGGFPLQENWWLARALHDHLKLLPWILTLVLFAGAAWPRGVLVELPLARRLQWPLTALLCSIIVAIVKNTNGTSCPWELREFGGVAQHISHWSGWLASDGGHGRCFPAGHATNGFAFIGGWFALREARPRAARNVLIASLVLGALFGIFQQMRGAHFTSHTLWTAWLCWTAAWATDPLYERWANARPDASRAVPQ